MRKIIHTFRMAFKDARKNLLHTLLSVLGIVIGVGALVSILSLIDGMEQYAHEQISRTTSLESVIVSTVTTKRIDNVLVAKERYDYFDYERFSKLLEQLPDVRGYMRYQESGFLQVNDTTERGVLFTGIVDTWNDQLELLSGRFIEKEDLINRQANVVVSKELAEAFFVGKSPEEVVGNEIAFKDRSYAIVGVMEAPSENLEIFAPITLVDSALIQQKPPSIMLMASTVEDVPAVKEKTEAFISEEFGASDDFRVVTNEFRVEQANQGFLVFRLVMGLIVGISVLVGGIGVMNVLLISVTERTAEIGVRKAVGAKRRDIVTQFLSESLSISFIGSFLGVVLGILFTLVAVPIIKHITKMPFEAAYTADTLFVIMVVSIIVGIVFGTYPALKASKLDPVEAIRRE